MVIPTIMTYYVDKKSTHFKACLKKMRTNLSLNGPKLTYFLPQAKQLLFEEDGGVNMKKVLFES